jgi:hypothetical protein
MSQIVNICPSIFGSFFVFETRYYVAHTGLKLEVLLPQPLSAGTIGMCHHTGYI